MASLIFITIFIAKISSVSYFRIIMDTNYWGLWCVPLGLVIGFGPALIAAALHRPKQPDVDQKPKK